MSTKQMSDKVREAYEFHIESVEFYKEIAESHRAAGRIGLAESYERDCVTLHEKMAERILQVNQPIWN